LQSSYYFVLRYFIVKLFSETPLQHPSHGVNPAPPTSSANIDTLKTLTSPSSQVNCNAKQSEEDDSTASAVAVAYNQQNAICT